MKNMKHFILLSVLWQPITLALVFHQVIISIKNEFILLFLEITFIFFYFDKMKSFKIINNFITKVINLKSFKL